MRRYLCILAIASLGQAPAVKGGTVTGQIVVTENAKPIKVDNAWVYLESTTKSSLSAKDVSAIIKQRSRSFDPHVVMIPKGASVFFPNNDPEEHNVFSPESNKIPGWIGFDLGRYNTDKKGRHRKFAELGEFDIYCDIHQEMWAKVKVVPSRYFALVVDGKYSIADVPPGTYNLVAWAPDSLEKRTTKPFTVADGTVTVESMNLLYSKSSHAHVRKDGSAYPPDYDKPK